MPTPSTRSGRSHTWLLILIAFMIIAALAVRFFWDRFVPDPTLVAQAPGLVTFDSLDAARGRIPERTLVATRSFDAEPVLVALYPQASPQLPAETVTIVYARDGWRFAEIQQRPGLTMEEAVGAYDAQHEEQLTIQGWDARMIRLRNAFSRCLSPREDMIGLCRISRILFLETDWGVVSIAGDGEHITSGEMVGIAKSLEPLAR